MSRNYRSPFPAYAASLGLMFRWFAKNGPKIIPSAEDLKRTFGFRATEPGPGQPYVLNDINDSHPGNHWCYTVTRFLSAQDAFLGIRSLSRRNVLWVRFGNEDQEFNYEQLAAFTYHPLDGEGVPDLIDKYIKGQDFSVVVIEGLPAKALRVPENPVPDGPDKRELEMWQARRELYLCASRANVFLFFVLRPDADGSAEIEELLRHVSAPKDHGRRLWTIEIAEGQPRRKPADIIGDDNVPAIPNETPAEEVIIKLNLPRNPTLGALVASLERARGLNRATSMDQVLEAVMPFGLTGLGMNTPLPLNQIEAIAEKLGVLIRVEGDGDVPAAPPRPQRPTVTAGMTVAQAAAALLLPVRRLEELLPAPYQPATELTSGDMERLAPLFTPGGETPQPVAPPPAVPNAARWRTSLAEHLWQYMQQPHFRSESSMVKKYVMLLSEFVRLKPAAVDILLNYRSRNRPYFTRTSEEITRDHDYASVHRLTQGGLFAMCTLSNESKLTVLRRVFGEGGLPPEDVRGILSGL